jgi:hypothetical protein
MELVRRSDSETVRAGSAILESKPFIRNFLHVFATEHAQAFLAKNARTDMEWTSIGVYVKLHAYVVKMLGYNPSEAKMAYYLHTIMTHNDLRRIALTALREKPRRRKKKMAILDTV